MAGRGEGSGTPGGTPPQSPPPPPPSSDGGPAGGGDLWGGERAGIIPLHPMSLGDVLDTAFKLFRATAAAAALTVAIVYGPLSLLTSLPGATLSFTDPTDPFAGMSGSALALAGFAMLVTTLVGPLVTAAVTVIAVQRERGGEMSWQDAYRVAVGRFGTILLATLLLFVATLAAVIVIALPAVAIGAANVGVGVLVGLVLLLPTLAAIIVLFYLIVPVILLEDVTATEAVRRSFALLRRRFWPTVGTVVVAGILIGIIGAVVSIAFSAVSVIAGPAAFLLQALGSTASSLVTVPLTANVALLIYLDARIRHEGLDIEVLTADLAREA